MKSVVLEMSVLSEFPFSTCIFYEAAVPFRCCSCVEISCLEKSRIGMRKSGVRRESGIEKKTAWGALRERVRVSVENTKLLSDGEQMSDCHCACIFLSNTGLGRRAVNGHLVAVRIERDRQFCQISWQQIDLNFKTRPTSRR